MMRYPSRQEVTEQAVKNLSRVRHAFRCVGYNSPMRNDSRTRARNLHSPFFSPSTAACGMHWTQVRFTFTPLSQRARSRMASSLDSTGSPHSSRPQVTRTSSQNSKLAKKWEVEPTKSILMATTRRISSQARVHQSVTKSSTSRRPPSRPCVLTTISTASPISQTVGSAPQSRSTGQSWSIFVSKQYYCHLFMGHDTSVPSRKYVHIV